MNKLINKFKNKKKIKAIVASEYFDLEYFQAYSNKSYSTIEAAAFDFLNSDNDFNPSSRFDSSSYLKANPDVDSTGENALLHYELFGKKEGRGGVAPVGYCKTLGILLEEQIQILNQSELFDADFYLSCYSDIKNAGIKPELHYLCSGALENRDPSKSFSTELYYLNNPDVREASVNPLLHYIKVGEKEGRTKYNSLIILEGEKSIFSESPFFDSNYYLEHNFDVKEAGIDPEVHYLEAGYKEGRNPSKEFNTNYYLEANPDVKAANINPLVHYINSGKQEKRACSPYYIEGHKVAFDPRDSNITQTLPVTGQYDSGKINSIAVHVHCHYLDVFKGMLKELKSIPKDPDFFVSCTSESIKSDALSILKAAGISVKQVFVSENRGRDISPMLVELSDVLLGYDLALHIHTKKSVEKAELGNEWLDNIKRNLLFNESYISAIYSQFSNDTKLGIISPETFWKIKPQMNWGGNYALAQKLYKRLGIDESALTDFELSFPAGSMFWFRPKAIRQLFDCQFAYQDFPAEPIPDDGTIAHAIERTFENICEVNGYSVMNIRPHRYEMHWPSYLKPKVSIVMPVYNAEKTITQAIESVLLQDCSHIPFELICVDNGSVDNSLKVLENYQGLHDNIKVAVETNKGAGCARNLGVNTAVGQYIVFLDADDVLATDAISHLYAGINTTESDMAVSSLVMFDEEEFTRAMPYQQNNAYKVVEGFNSTTTDPVWEAILNDFGPCAKIYKKQFLDGHQISFPENVNYEDNLFIFDCYLQADKINIIPKATYYYRKFNEFNGGTQSTEYSLENLKDQFGVIELIINKRKSDALHPMIKQALLQKIKWLVPYYPQAELYKNLQEHSVIMQALDINNNLESLAIKAE